MLIEFTLNSQKVRVDVPSDMTLVNLLREELGLTGTKKSCEIGECGSCSIILDHRLVNSCMVFACQVAGREVVTIEGICKQDGSPTDLQENFIDYGAVQCGFCTPGMILAAEALLIRNQSPTRREIREAISGNLCRCTGYQQIVDAIEVTAKQRQKVQQESETF
jgi:aerobic carbon-monoxide dehydrogenase small subunit